MRVPARPPAYTLLLQRLSERDRLADVFMRSHTVGATVGGRYRHWDSIRQMDPPEGLSSEEWWTLIKSARTSDWRTIPLVDRRGERFGFAITDDMLRMLRRADLDLGGSQGMPSGVATPEQRDRFVRSSLREEAITSSQLEGAATTRKVAKEMLLSNRPPRTDDERMIVNNYRAMEAVRALGAEPLSPEAVLDLQRVVTDGVLAPTLQGLRRAGRDEDVGVYHNGTLLHRPPPPDELPERLAQMCAFANADDTDDGTFLHPALRAIALHFWLAYDHPFVDGNGRTARALFYWAMRRHGFWLAEFLSISRLIRQAPAKYGRSFLYTETDGNDLTYFLLSQLRIVERATEDLRTFVDRKTRELRETEALLRPTSSLNHRQVALLSHALCHPGRSYTVQSHRASHGVAYQTARKDLLDLAERGFLKQDRLQRQGRALVFAAPPDLGDRLREPD